MMEALGYDVELTYVKREEEAMAFDYKKKYKELERKIVLKQDILDALS